MKISKVRHIKAGIKEKPVENGGMLYTYPGRNAGVAKLQEHVKDLNSKAQKLYKVFVPVTETSYEQKYSIVSAFFEKYVIGGIKNSKSIDAIADRILSAQGEHIEYTKVTVDGRKRRKQKSTGTIGEFNEKARGADCTTAANHIVDLYLRNSLRKGYKSGDKSVYLPDVIKKVIEALFSGEAYTEIIKFIGKENLILAVDAIRADYSKEEQLKKIVKSIESQNSQVQVDEGREKLVLSSAYNEKKRYIFSFIKDYAAADKAGQEDILKRMHYLMVLYYYGQDVANEAEADISAWSFGVMVNERDGAFSDQLLDFMLTKDNAPAGDKAYKRHLDDQMKKETSKAIVEHYQAAIRCDGLTDDEKKWIGYISDHASKLLSQGRLSEYKIKTSYLCKKTWEEWVSFIAKKYIEMGKGVYNFAMNDVGKVASGEPVVIGSVDDKYKEGISSFDYERLKAEDMLNRGLAGYVSFAVNAFDSSVRDAAERDKKNREDILSLNMEKGEIVMRGDSGKKVMRYFGGESQFEGTAIANMSPERMIDALKRELVVSRNSSFHFADSEYKASDTEVINALFEKEFSSVGAVYRKRFFSNNVPMFYSVQNIDKLMDTLYSSKKYIPAQVPSFNKVLSRKIVNEFLVQYVSTKARAKVSEPGIAEKYRSSMYFILKEIYYYQFLKEENLGRQFTDVLDKAYAEAKSQLTEAGRKLKEITDKSERKTWTKRKKEAQNTINAHDDFMRRYTELSNSGMSFEDICQEIMTEYNQQNNQKKKKAAGYKRQVINESTGKTTPEIVPIEDNTQIYKHYRTLLYVGLRGAFLNYLKVNGSKYDFLKEPENRGKQFGNVVEAEFISSWNTSAFDYLKDAIKGNRLACSWYVTAHFLNPKNLNHLIGLLKNYVQFINDIERRAAVTGNRCESVKAKTEKYTSIIEVLEFAKLYCGQVSNKIEDYFDDKEAYAEYISRFVDFDGVGTAALMEFCHRNAEAMYYDDTNPVPNRNIILSSLYGNTDILSETMEKIDEKLFKDIRKSKKNISDILEKGVCETYDEQKKLRRYQTLKNKIEFVDVLTLTELMNDLYGQLISYSYLRERDLMYMQLGYYYIKLFHTDSVDTNSVLRKLDGDCHIVDGAILYQIMALYSYSYPMYTILEGVASKDTKSQSIGSKFSPFINEYCNGDESIYEDSVRFFEDVDDMHDKMVALRQYIDHFKYFAKPTKSIMELFSEIYDGFFSYDIKLKKSVSYVLPNILLSYFVNAKLDFGKKTIPGKNDSYNGTLISLRDVKTDYFTFKAGKVNASGKSEDNSEEFVFDAATLMANMNGGGIKEDKKNGKGQSRNDNTVTDDGKLYEVRTEAFLMEVVKLLEYSV